jgi:serine/threonine-protein kinase
VSTDRITEQLARLQAALAGRYAVERPLGAGGMAIVYLAEDLKHGRKVAIKVVRPELAATVGSGRFLREIETAARLNHPNILAVYDSGDADGLLYYVMPYVEDETLRGRLDRVGTMPLEEALQTAAGIAQALDYAHKRGVIHRDVKPENILFAEGHPIVTDFGVAIAARAGGGRLTQTGAPVGTPAYMSPEQAQGVANLDARTDVYSLGCVVCEMLAGDRTFAVPVLASDPSMFAAVPPAVANVIRRALARDPADRPASAGELVAELRAAAGAVSGEGAPPVPRPRRSLVIGVAAGVVLGAAAWWGIRTLGAEREFESLAVLPLENLMGDSAQDYFVDGMTEALITGLAQIEALKVISRTSVLRYRGTEKSIPTIARELGVDAVVEGSVLRVGDRVRITAQLIDAQTDRHLWAQSYERDLTDVLSLQMDVARAIAEEIRITISPAERARMDRERAVRPEAYEAYLRGRFHWGKRTRAGFTAALEEFRRAIELDPDFALPHSGLADVYVLLVEWGYLPPEEGIPRARAAALEALNRDSTLAEAYTSLGEVRLIQWEWDAAEQAYRRALELNPGYATGHQWYGFFLSKMGRHDEAVAELGRALELDPLSLIVHTEYGRVLYHARRFEEALQLGRQALALDSGFVDGYWVLGRASLELGRYRQAIAALQRIPEFPYRNMLAATYAKAGRPAEARRVLEAYREWAAGEDGYLSPGLVAETFAALGYADSAMAWAERAYASGMDSRLTYLKVEPVWDPVRDDPRFQGLLRRMRFP